MIRLTALRRSALLLALLACGVPMSRADYRAGVEAHAAGDFDRALAEWSAVAAQPIGEVDPSIHAEAFYALAMLYWLGQGVRQDTAQSAAWLQRAADLNHAGAQAKLGYLYLIGQGVAQNNFEALKWLQMAAHQDDADAQYNLGVMYRDGHGVPQIPERAIAWFSEAAANGDPVSRRIIADYQRTGTLTAEISLVEEVARYRAEPVTGPVPEPGSAEAPSQWPKGLQDESWIAARNSGHFTIQVIAVRQLDGVLEFVQRYPELQPFALYRQGSVHEPLWVLIQGDYPNPNAARSIRAQFPTDIQPRDKLWIRQMSMVQSLLQ